MYVLTMCVNNILSHRYYIIYKKNALCYSYETQFEQNCNIYIFNRCLNLSLDFRIREICEKRKRKTKEKDRNKYLKI